ncbi:hypothetical protein ACQ4M3_34585 [Leptolyngbya sp. AN03gr2]|uniref:hypothetical protein n=1 Tax=unclassified Leptolyngbya TaxID=2650499 RepID=UPI003D319E46
MSQIKIDRSKSYREFLLTSLNQDVEHAAGYIEAALEERDSDPAFLAKLLQSVMEKVVMAKYLEEAIPQELQEKLAKFNQTIEVYDFIELLDMLGFEVAVRPKS